MKLIIHSTKWLSYVFATLVGIALLAMIGLFYTPAGLKLLVWGAEKAVPQLHIGASSGAVFPQFSLYKVSYKDQQLGIDSQIKRVSLGLNPTCFLKPSVCIQELSVDNANIKLTETQVHQQSQAKPEQSTGSKISLPIPLLFERVNLSNIQMDLYGDKVSLASLSTQGRWQGNQLVLGTSKVDKLVVEPNMQTSSASPVAANSKPSSSPSLITLPKVTLPLDINLSRIEVDGFTLQQEQPFVVNHFVFEGRGQDHDISIKYLSIKSPYFDGEMQGKVSLQGEYPISAKLKANIKKTDFAGQKISLSLAGSVGNLDLNSHFSGPIEGKLFGSIHPLISNIPFDLTLSGANSQWPLSGKSDYQFAVANLKLKGNLDQYSFNLDGNVNGNQVPETSLSAIGTGSLYGLNFRQLTADTLGGKLNGEVKLDWKSLFSWQANLSLDSIQPNKQWPEVEGDLSGQLETNGAMNTSGGWELSLPKVAITGSLRNQPFHLKGSASVSDSNGNGRYIVTTPSLVLSHGPNSITAKGELGEQWNMQLTVAFPKLSETLPDLSGQINGTVRVTDSLSKPKVDLKLTADNLDWQNNLTVKKLSLDGAVAPFSDYQSDLVLKSQNVEYQSQIIQSLRAGLSGTLSYHSLVLSVDNKRVSTQLNLKGDFKPGQSWAGVLESMSVHSRMGTWQLNTPTDIAYLFSKQEASISPHCWVNGRSSICLDSKAMIGKSGQAAISLNDLSLHQVAGFLPQGIDFKGVANAKATMKWAPNQPPQLTLTVAMPDGEVIRQGAKPVNIGWNAISLDANLKNNQLNSKWHLSLKDNGDISGHMDIPDVRKKNKLIDGELKVSQLNLNFLAPLIGTYSKLGANINSDLKLKGAINQPEIYGQVNADNIIVKGDISPVDVDSGKVSIKFDGKQSTLAGSIQTPEGKVDIAGDAKWRNFKDWQANAHVSATGLLVNATSMAKLKVVPDLSISVTPKLANITGNIALPWGEIVVEKLPPNAIKVSKDQVLLNAKLKPKVEKPAVPFKVQSDVKITIGNDVSISAFGLKGKLQGELRVTQNEKGPFVVGEVNILDGTYQSFGQDLQIQSGKVLMNGPIDQPYIAITAIRNPANTQDEVTAGIKVTGPADDPVVSVFSDPSMPQANALSYLLRGQNIDTQSGNGTMTTTLIGLSLAQSGKVVGQIGQAFGVQDLHLDTAGAGDTSQVVVSGYVLPNLQVKYGVGIFNPVGEFTVRYQLISNLYLEAVSGLDSAVDILYQFEFN